MSDFANDQSQRRHGTRVRAQIPVRITSLDPAVDFAEHCHTLLVNPRGCGVRCSRQLEPGLHLRIDELPGRGIAGATVACTRPLNGDDKYWMVGIALESPGNLWCIAPAPDDWGCFAAPAKFYPVPASVRLLGEDPLSGLFSTEIRVGKA